jgi:hypothetical protein
MNQLQFQKLNLKHALLKTLILVTVTSQVLFLLIVNSYNATLVTLNYKTAASKVYTSSIAK